MRTKTTQPMETRPYRGLAGMTPTTRRHPQFARRGNAMIMAVALTVLLAIIGSSFVLMARLDRQTVRNASVSTMTDAALNAVIVKIQKVLADDVVGAETYTDVNGNGRYDAGEPFVDVNGNSRYDGVLLLDGVVSSLAASREAFDAPWIDASSGLGDAWLASNEPNGSTTTNVYEWPKMSDLDGIWGDQSKKVAVGQSLGNPTPDDLTGMSADADGDGIPDSVVVRLPGVATPDGKKVYYAVRIIDNCGLPNVNTAWKRDVPSGSSPDVNISHGLLNPLHPADWSWEDSYGDFRHQIDLYRLLSDRYGLTANLEFTLDDVLALHNARMYGQSFNTNGNYSLASLYYEDLILRDYGWFGWLPGFVDGNRPFQAFGLDDEFELRNRGSINTTTQTPLETALGTTTSPLDVLGAWDPADPTGIDGRGYRLLPYTFGDLKDRQRWFAQLTNDPAVLSTLGKTAKRGPRADQRHLFTTISYDREIRVRDANDIGDDVLDGSSILSFLVGGQVIRPGAPGKFRKVNINTVLRTLMEQGSKSASSFDDPTNPLPPLQPAEDADNNVLDKLALKIDAVERVVAAFVAAGYTPDEGFQFLANLIDYLDTDQAPWVFLSSQFPTPTSTPSGPCAFAPSRTIYGTERQPFIVEVFNQVEDSLGSKTSKAAAVELFNPYDAPLSMAGLQLWYNKSLLIDLATDDGGAAMVIQPRSSLVYAKDAATAGSAPFKAIKDAFKLDPNLTEAELCLVRIVPAWDSSGDHQLVLDRVRKSDMMELHKEKANDIQSNSIWRGIALPMNPMPSTIPAASIAPWGWARNVFCARQDTAKLGNLNKIDTSDSKQNSLAEAGIPVSVADRGGVLDTTVTPNVPRYRVGWYDLSRVLFVGNPDLQTMGSTTAAETYTDSDGNGKYDVGEPFDDANHNGVFDRVAPDVRPLTERLYEYTEGDSTHTQESDVRLDFRPLSGSAPARLFSSAALARRISLTSRTDDRMDNENADGDNLPATNFDSLMECRVAGRINVNTAPKAVLRALFPALTYDGYVNSPSAPSTLATTVLDQLSDGFAQAVIAMREIRPFESLADFEDRLARFDNPQGIAELPPGTGQGGSLWYGRMLDYALNRPIGTAIVGDPFRNDDAEERDWIFSRIANLITVRSDTFTAYILIRVQNSNSMTDYTDQRYVAILDRSNVFLPESAGRNGLKYLDANGNGQFDSGELYEHWDDANGNNIVEAAELIDADGDGKFDPDESGEMAIYDPKLAVHGNDPDYYDRKYTTPKVVAIREVPDVR